MVKVASNFYENPRHGLPSSNGTVLVFSQKTGELIAILLDEGYLTDVRTGVAGAVIAKYFAPSKVDAIGVVGPGTHITAIGADAPNKQELDPYILQRSDILIADSLSQCRDYGEMHQALQVGVITEERVVELGRSLITGGKRQSDTQLTVAVLTGVAVQDTQIATTVLSGLSMITSLVQVAR